MTNLIPNLRGLRAGSLLLGAWLVAGVALGQDEALPPYDVQGLEHKRVWIPWMFAFGFAILTVVIAFKNPRRSHQD